MGPAPPDDQRARLDRDHRKHAAGPRGPPAAGDGGDKPDGDRRDDEGGHEGARLVVHSQTDGPPLEAAPAQPPEDQREQHGCDPREGT